MGVPCCQTPNWFLSLFTEMVKIFWVLLSVWFGKILFCTSTGTLFHGKRNHWNNLCEIRLQFFLHLVFLRNCCEHEIIYVFSVWKGLSVGTTIWRQFSPSRKLSDRGERPSWPGTRSRPIHTGDELIRPRIERTIWCEFIHRNHFPVPEQIGTNCFSWRKQSEQPHREQCNGSIHGWIHQLVPSIHPWIRLRCEWAIIAGG